MRATSIFLIAVLILPAVSLAETIIPPGLVSGTWTQAGSPYLVQGDISINETSTLNIEPGVEVIFQGYYRLLCLGRLLAVGTQEDSILFTTENTLEGWDGLDFVDLESNLLDSSKLEYSEISYGKASRRIAGIDFKHGGAFHFRNSSKVSVSRCLIAHNRTAEVWGADGADAPSSWPSNHGNPGYPGESAVSGNGGAIYCFNSSPIIIHNKISSNSTGNAYGGSGGHGEDKSCGDPTFGGDGGEAGNGISGAGGAVYLENSNPLIYSNIFYRNLSGTGTGGAGGEGGYAHVVAGWYDAFGGAGGEGGAGSSGQGGAIYFCESNIVLTNNLFIENKTGDGYGGNGGNGGEAIGNYGYGGAGGDGIAGQGGCGLAVFCENNSSIAIDNCTFSHHLNLSLGQGGAGGWGGSGNFPGSNGGNGTSINGGYIASGVQMTIVNSIVWNNLSPMINDKASVNYSCIEGGFPGMGNISLDPIFTSQLLGDYFLSQISAGQSQQSPCVDEGCPDSSIIIGTTRTDGFQDEEIVDMGYHYPLFEEQPFITLNPVSLIFNAYTFSGNPEVQVFQISNSWMGTFNFVIEENIEWLTASPTSGGPVPPSAYITVSVDIAGLQYGYHSGGIEINASPAINNPQTVNVSLILNCLSGPLTGYLNPAVYLVTDNIYVNQGDSLIIEPGAKLLFDSGCCFVIEGCLSAVGTEEDSIFFLPNEGISSWEGIDISSEDPILVVLEYCYITGSNSSGINIFNTPSIIKHCTVTGNFNDISGGGILTSNGSQVIMHCDISGNTSGMRGGGISASTSYILIEDCVISNNYSESGGGLYIYLSSSTVSYSVISNNSAVNYGGGISYVDCPSYWHYIIVDNCTISRNYAGSHGSGIYRNNNCCSPVITNTILEGNRGALALAFLTSSTIVAYCDFFNNSVGNFTPGIVNYLGIINNINVNGDSCDLLCNIFLDPMFINPEAGDFHLTADSPCIDAGDPTFPNDPDSTIADMGAYYFDQSGDIRCLTISISGGNAHLDWMDKPFASVYRIYRSDTPYFDTAGMTPYDEINISEYIDYGAVNDGVWYYRVTWE
ncbi:hypothetical protein ISS30_09150 [bacterium]|nr:hypothetical protein [bacterium]